MRKNMDVTRDKKKKVLLLNEKENKLICILLVVGEQHDFYMWKVVYSFFLYNLTISIAKQRIKAQLSSVCCVTERWMGFIFSVSNLFFLKGRWIILILNGNCEQCWPNWIIDLCKREESGFVTEWASVFPLPLSSITVSLEKSSLTSRLGQLSLW